MADVTVEEKEPLVEALDEKPLESDAKNNDDDVKPEMTEESSTVPTEEAAEEMDDFELVGLSPESQQKTTPVNKQEDNEDDTKKNLEEEYNTNSEEMKEQKDGSNNEDLNVNEDKENLENDDKENSENEDDEQQQNRRRQLSEVCLLGDYCH